MYSRDSVDHVCTFQRLNRVSTLRWWSCEVRVMTKHRRLVATQHSSQKLPCVAVQAQRRERLGHRGSSHEKPMEARTAGGVGVTGRPRHHFYTRVNSRIRREVMGFVGRTHPPPPVTRDRTGEGQGSSWHSPWNVAHSTRGSCPGSPAFFGASRPLWTCGCSVIVLSQRIVESTKVDAPTTHSGSSTLLADFSWIHSTVPSRASFGRMQRMSSDASQISVCVSEQPVPSMDSIAASERLSPVNRRASAQWRPRVTLKHHPRRVHGSFGMNDGALVETVRHLASFEQRAPSRPLVVDLFVHRPLPCGGCDSDFAVGSLASEEVCGDLWRCVVGPIGGSEPCFSPHGVAGSLQQVTRHMQQIPLGSFDRFLSVRLIGCVRNRVPLAGLLASRGSLRGIFRHCWSHPAVQCGDIALHSHVRPPVEAPREFGSFSTEPVKQCP